MRRCGGVVPKRSTSPSRESRTRLSKDSRRCAVGLRPNAPGRHAARRQGTFRHRPPQNGAAEAGAAVRLFRPPCPRLYLLALPSGGIAQPAAGADHSALFASGRGAGAAPPPPGHRVPSVLAFLARPEHFPGDHGLAAFLESRVPPLRPARRRSTRLVFLARGCRAPVRRRPAVQTPRFWHGAAATMTARRALPRGRYRRPKSPWSPRSTGPSSILSLVCFRRGAPCDPCPRAGRSCTCRACSRA